MTFWCYCATFQNCINAKFEFSHNQCKNTMTPALCYAYWVNNFYDTNRITVNSWKGEPILSKTNWNFRFQELRLVHFITKYFIKKNFVDINSKQIYKDLKQFNKKSESDHLTCYSIVLLLLRESWMYGLFVSYRNDGQIQER